MNKANDLPLFLFFPVTFKIIILEYDKPRVAEGSS